MKIILLAAGAAAIAFSAGAAAAAPTVAGPKQPIPYSELSAYMKASPKARMHKDWWSGQTAQASADTGTSANTSATAPSLPADTSGGATKEAAPQLPSPAVTPPTPGAVNPSAAVTPGAPDSTTPPK